MYRKTVFLNCIYDVNLLSFSRFNPSAISNLSAAVSVTIDGRDGTAWERDVSKAADVDLWEPPALRDPVATLEFSDASPTVTVEYWPIWL